MGKYFGTDGFRGEANVNLTVEHAYQVGRFLGWYYGKDKEEKCKVVIGKDTRRSSYMFEYSLVAGLTASGADVYLLHVTTTPSVSYVVRTEDFDCGIMISASHNPYYDNGIKLINSNGEKMDEETILLVEDYIDGKLRLFGQEWKELPYAHKDAIGCTVDYVAGRNRYMGYLISLGVYSFKGMKVGLDCANGSSWNMAKSIFEALGAKCYVINNEPNGLNINNNAGSTHIEGLQKYVVDNGLDVGFAYDGDADRCIAVDENGNVIFTKKDCTYKYAFARWITDVYKTYFMLFVDAEGYATLVDVNGKVWSEGKKYVKVGPTAWSTSHMDMTAVLLYDNENGNYNFETIASLDVDLLTKHINQLLDGEEIDVPSYNFISGKREYRGHKLKIGEKDVLVMEGIHGLNGTLTNEIPEDAKYRIYVSALNQINLDEHNRIPSSDGRLLRRIVRDAMTRGNDARETISRWDSVRKGEEDNIFPYQEYADVMFNSSLIYELGVLKQYVEPLLLGLSKDSPEYVEAKRLLKFLDYFVGIGNDNVPTNSLLREFIGGGCFHV